MRDKIRQLCGDIRLKLANIESGLRNLVTQSNRGTEIDALELRNHLNKIQLRVVQGQARIGAARNEVKNWTDEQKAQARDEVAGRKAARDAHKLKDHADGTERYAAAAAEIALGALDIAEQAALQAWLARLDAESARSKRTLRLVG